MNARTCRYLALVMLLPVLGACTAPAPVSEPAPTSGATRPPLAASLPTSDPVATSVEPTVDSASQPAVDAAIAQFTADTGIPASEIDVVRVEPMTWSDSSLGCNKSGMSYLQVLTPGYRITLESGEQREVYHTTDGQNGAVSVVKCQQPAGAAINRPQVDLGNLSAGPLDLARRDLATRLGTDAPIELAESSIAPVGQLICEGTPITPRPNAPAYVVFEFVLKSGDSQHLYRATGDRILYCGPFTPAQVDDQGNPTR